MDNNQPIPPKVPPIESQPITPQAPLQPTPGKPVLFFIAGIILIITLVGGIYFYLNSMQTQDTVGQAVSTPTPVATQEVSTRDLQAELDSINITTDDASLLEVDEDLTKL